ncbi:hypothetical protein FQN57_000952 [Myotisia sp. PD_48]|nr:hypothetical protein FQN57_000952 [Myotisia sp. PD_48]
MSSRPDQFSKPKQFSIPISKDSSRHSPVVKALPRRARKFEDHESDHEDEQQPVHEEVTGFDHAAGGAIITHKRIKIEKQPLVIKVDKRNKWRDRLQKPRRSLLPAEVQAQRRREAQPGATEESTTEVEGPSTQYGLSFAEPKDDQQDEAAAEDSSALQDIPEDEEEKPQKPLTEDDVALQALIRESKGTAAEANKSNLVISQKDLGRGFGEYDETKTFRQDIATRPEPATLKDYAAVPVEEFGAALLRGMGWKEGQPVGRGRYGNTNLKPRVPERRPGYLGIGAKDIGGKAGNAEATLGAWGKTAMKKAKNEGEGLYTPVLMRSKKTGELITEDEFKRLTQDKDPDDWKERKDRDSRKAGREPERERERGRDSDKYSRDNRRDSTRRNARGSPQYRSREEEKDRNGDRHRKRHHDERGKESDRYTVSSSRGHRDREHGSRRGIEADDDRHKSRHRGRDADREYDRDRDRRKHYDRERRS